MAAKFVAGQDLAGKSPFPTSSEQNRKWLVRSSPSFSDQRCHHNHLVPLIPTYSILLHFNFAESWYLNNSGQLVLESDLSEASFACLSASAMQVAGHFMPRHSLVGAYSPDCSCSVLQCPDLRMAMLAPISSNTSRTCHEIACEPLGIRHR
jgi:hypothetical protein